MVTGRVPLLLVVLVAGCATPPTPVPEATPAFGPPVPVSDVWPGAEPVLARAGDGTLYLEGIGRAAAPPAAVEGNVNKVWRSTDDGATWLDVTPPLFGQERSNDGFVAAAEDGTVYAANVFSLTFQVFRSDDRGDTWERLNLPPFPALMHRHWILPRGGALHVSLEALPPSFASFLGGIPPPAAQTGNPNEGMWYLRSDDRGATWTAPVQIDPVVNFAGQSAMVADAAGQRLYVARYEEPGRDPVEYAYGEGHWYLLASEDGGQSWERREMFELAGETSTAVPGLALADDGALYFVFTQQSGNASRLHLASSRDGGRAWTAPRELPLPPGTHAMPWAAARGPGELAVMWYAADAQGAARELDEPWFVDFAWLAGADTAAPTARAARVTPEPVHEGNICAKGPACAAGEDRRLLDYPWLIVGADGLARLAFASTQWERPSAFAVFAAERAPGGAGRQQRCAGGARQPLGEGAGLGFVVRLRHGQPPPGGGAHLGLVGGPAVRHVLVHLQPCADAHRRVVAQRIVPGHLAAQRAAAHREQAGAHLPALAVQQRQQGHAAEEHAQQRPQPRQDGPEEPRHARAQRQHRGGQGLVERPGTVADDQQARARLDVGPGRAEHEGAEHALVRAGEGRGLGGGLRGAGHAGAWGAGPHDLGGSPRQ